ncbi:MAG: hypothetical protein P8R42_00555 [Candidatus Binatia bacterium]|nr:hypothetical protein [Candidatus Binatia bacterium]
MIAPHGGLSETDLLSAAAAGRRGNDLHTAVLARELAVRLEASRLVNPSCDRNRIDLNRVRDVVDRAPWFLELIEEHVARILSAHPTALILLVHGWHVGQARCDLGIGASLARAEEADAHADRLTGSTAFVTGPLETFRQRLASAGVLATYGERWPAAHRNNVMRLFRHRPAVPSPAPGLAKFVEAGRVNAVQLELGAPLRWPGRLRQDFVESAAQVFRGESVGPQETRRSEAKAVAPDGPSPRSLGLQAFDPGAGREGLGVIVGAMHLPGKDVGARLQLFPGGQRMGIFTGHGQVGPVLGVPDLHFEPTASGFDAFFEGNLLETDDAAAYFQREEEQAGARLRPASVRLSFERRDNGFGHVRGRVDLGGEVFEVSCAAFADLRLARPGGARQGTRILGAFDDGSAVRLEGEEEGGTWLVSTLGAQSREDTERLGRVCETGPGAWRLEFEGGDSFSVRVRTQAALLRPVGPQEYVHTTFGVVHVQSGDDRTGSGFYERRRPV